MNDPVARAAAILRRGGRLAADDALALFRSGDPLAAGRLALERKRAVSGDRVHYAPSLHVNLTNVCRLRCPICSRSRDEDAPDAFLLDPAEAAGALARLRDGRIVEAHLLCGVAPRADLAYALEVLRALKEIRPGLALLGFTAVEIDAFAAAEGLTLRETLARLRAAGLDALPGGGAEIFAPRVRALVAPEKPDADRWFAVMREAAALGLPVNAAMRYGHVETPAERADHLARLRDFQDRTGAFRCIELRAFRPGAGHLPGVGSTGGLDDLMTCAVTRLFLDNVPHVRVPWTDAGLAFAEVALHFGADDLGMTAPGPPRRAADGRGPETPGEDGLRHAIAAAGFAPVATDSAYRREHPYPDGEAA